MPMTAARRPLAFARLDEIMPEVDRLLEGHTTAGRWTLAQICNHLATVVRQSVEGFHGQLPWVVRATLGPVARRRLFRTGRIPEGIMLPESYLPRPGTEARAEAEALRDALRRFVAHDGPFHDHPMLGPMTGDDWVRLHCIHCAHHLSFVLPAERTD